jgi:serine/threonine protein kinase
MQNADWIKIKEVFNQTLDLPFSERESFLQNYDDFIQTEVRNLIESDEQADEFIEQPAAVEFGISQDLNIWQIIDDYKVIGLIGEGGMGNVYLAERIGFEQKVALKLIKRGMDTRAVLKRFKLERQILSQLNHPNIAKLLGGGETKDGLPYFAMEYIEGDPITKFCEHQQFDIYERLELFQKVCDAVSYAHKNLIVHRDIKPSNIIVTNDGTPKLLDFGIAKLLDNETENTATVGRMFTPEYASPEQLNGLPITTATDVYSLGVVLYELLSGVRPFNCKSKSYGEIANLILTQEPQKPSSVVSSRWSVVSETAENRDETQIEINNPKSKIQNPKSLRGDLDNIILKALSKDSENRYQTVNDFSADIWRHLQGLPVTATNATARYRFQKFVQRNKKSVVMASFVGLLILSISGVAVWQAITANRERAKAERRLLETRKLANSLMFEIHDSLQDLPGATKSRELLVKKALEYLDSIYQESTDNPELLKELSIAYRKVADIQGEPYQPNLGQTTEALANYFKAYEIQNNLVEKSPQDLDLRFELASTTDILGKIHQDIVFDHEKAFEFFLISQKQWEFLLINKPDDAVVKINLAESYNSTSGLFNEKGELEASSRDRDLAIKHSEEAWQLDSENVSVLIKSARLFSQIGNEYGNPDYNDSGEPEKALPLLLRSLTIRENLFLQDSANVTNQTNVAVSLRDLAEIYSVQDEYGKAKELLQKALAIHENLAKQDSGNYLSEAHLGFCLNKL